VSSEEEKIIEERIYTVPIKKLMRGHRGLQRAKKAMKVLREFVKRHMHAEDVKIMQEVNEEIWKNGIRNPPRKIRIRVIRTEDNVIKVYLAK